MTEARDWAVNWKAMAEEQRARIEELERDLKQALEEMNSWHAETVRLATERSIWVKAWNEGATLEEIGRLMNDFALTEVTNTASKPQEMKEDATRE